MPEWGWLIDAALRCRMAKGTTAFDDAETRAARTFITLVARKVAGLRVE